MDALEVTEQHDQNGQADSRLSSGHGQDEEDENLTREVLKEMRKSDKIHVDRKKHQLDCHQQHNQVFSVEKYADNTDSEENRSQYQEM